MKIAVIGAGLMGRAAVYDLCRADGVKQVGVFDIDDKLAEEIGNKYGTEICVSSQFDASDFEGAKKLLEEYDAAISCVTYKYNPDLTRAAIEAKCHFFDLGGNNDVVRTQLEMDAAAREADVIVIPDCGLAPGMVSVLVADGIKRLDKTSSVKIRVGGLPQVPRPPLNYQMVFSAEGLINEYWEPCVILEGGQKKTVKPMSEVELLEFDGVGRMEAFYTSGGTSTLPETFTGQIDFLDYKTIRYPGHCELFRPILEVGLASRQEIEVNRQMVEPRALLKAVLDKNLSFDEPDMVLVRVSIEGEKEGAEKSIVYEIIDRQDSRTGLTAMMRTTSFPATIIAWMAASNQITARGCCPQEKAVSPGIFMQQLKKRSINLIVREE